VEESVSVATNSATGLSWVNNIW